MILDICSIKEGHSVIQQQSDLASVKDDLPPMEGEVTCILTIDRNAATLYILVQFTGIFELECARCLSKYHQKISGDFRLILQEKEGYFGPSDNEETADFYFDSSHSQVDISPYIFDEIMISLPLKPLCRIECKGITMGSNDNSPTEPTYDPRWEALRGLRDKK